MTSEAPTPKLYGPWLDAIIQGPIPRETKATCDNCAMLPSPASSPRALYFHPSAKCCTFQPQIPNFLAGAILCDEDPAMAEGRKILEHRIARRVVVNPRWAGPGELFPLLYRHIPHVFGQAPALRCHFLTATGACGVWKWRPAVCATWFCKHVRGETGNRFWEIAHKLLKEVEHQLTIWCLAELGMGAAELEELMKPDGLHVSELEGEIDWQRYRRVWGKWAGREVEFYRSCGQRVEPLSWNQVEEVCGPRVRVFSDLLRDAYAHLNSEWIPERLQLGEINLTYADKDGYRVAAYSRFDPLIAPEPLLRTLRYFDGRPTEEALEAIRVEQGIRMDLSLVRRLVDFRILKAFVPETGALPVLQ
jgi:hypothetical protein